MPNIGPFRFRGRGQKAEGKSNKEGLLSICIVSFFVLFILFAHTHHAYGAAKTWDGGGGNNLWSTAANWSPDGVPTYQDDVTIGNGYSVLVGTNSVVANSVTINSGATLTVTGNTFQVNDTLTNDGTFTISGTPNYSTV